MHYSFQQKQYVIIEIFVENDEKVEMVDIELDIALVDAQENDEIDDVVEMVEIY